MEQKHVIRANNNVTMSSSSKRTKNNNTFAVSTQYRPISPVSSNYSASTTPLPPQNTSTAVNLEDLDIILFSDFHTQESDEMHRTNSLRCLAAWLIFSLVLLIVSLIVLAEARAATGSSSMQNGNNNNRLNDNFLMRCNLQDPKPHGGAVTGVKECSSIAADVMQKNGSAVDAAIASMLCLEVMHPQSTGISGGGFLLLFHPRTGDAKAYDFREVVPAGLVDAIRASKGKLSPAQDAAYDIGVPGMIRGLGAVHQAYGKLPWADLFAPNINLLRNGFAATTMFAYRTSVYPKSKYMNDALKRYITSDAAGTQPIAPGQLIRRPELASVYERIAQLGPEEFYTGQLAQDFVNEVQALGGVITMQDMRNYQVRMREPILTRLGTGVDFYTLPSPSSGAALVFAMKMMEKFERNAQLRTKNSVDEATRVHFMIETLKMMFLQRTKLGDPDTPGGRNVRRSELDMMSDATIDRVYNAVNWSHVLAKPADYYRAVDVPYNASGKPDQGTSGAVFIDNDGLIVSTVHSVNSVFGSGIMSQKLGMVFNDELDDFGTATTIGGPADKGSDDVAAEYVANQMEPGKRPLSSMVPTIFYTPSSMQCGPRGASAGEGGARILSATAQTLWRLLLRGQSLEQAVEEPRLYVYRPKDDVQTDRPFPNGIMEMLIRDKGQKMVLGTDVRMSSLNVIVRINDTVIGEADSRRDAVELVYKK